ncbi:MAG TPA: hypothetical protein VFZ58_05570 [Candidatus Saccharimonadales bacterium]
MTHPYGNSQGGHFGSPQKGPAKDSFDILVGAATILAAVIAVVALVDRSKIIIVGVISAVVFLVLTAHALRQRNRTNAVVLGLITVLVVIGTALYGSVTASTQQQGEDGKKQGSSTTETSRYEGDTSTTPPETTQSAPTKRQPDIKGNTKMMPGQAIDLESSKPEAKAASGLSPADDIYVDQLAFGRDQEGALLVHDPTVAADYESCKQLLASTPRPAQQLAAHYNFYCIVTSEGNIASIQFDQGSGINMGRIGSITYKVWRS